MSKGLGEILRERANVLSLRADGYRALAKSYEPLKEAMTTQRKAIDEDEKGLETAIKDAIESGDVVSGIDCVRELEGKYLPKPEGPDIATEVKKYIKRAARKNEFTPEEVAKRFNAKSSEVYEILKDIDYLSERKREGKTVFYRTSKLKKIVRREKRKEYNNVAEAVRGYVPQRLDQNGINASQLTEILGKEVQLPPGFEVKKESVYAALHRLSKKGELKRKDGVFYPVKK